MISVSLDHLPEPMQGELGHVRDIVLDEFAEAMRGKQAAHRKVGRVLKLILHGGFAQPDWRAQPPGQAFDLLVILNLSELADPRHWYFARHRLHRAWETGEIARPVRLAVHGLREVNSALAEGLPYFIAMTFGGVILYELDRTPLMSPRNLSPSQRLELGRREFDRWYPKAGDFLVGADFYRERGNGPMAALMLHQVCEHLYRCVTWTLTLHGLRSHVLDELRGLAEAQDARLGAIWPRTSRFERRSFACLRRAYVDVRYAPTFKIGADELAWAAGRVALLHERTREICLEWLDALALESEDGEDRSGEAPGCGRRMASSVQYARHVGMRLGNYP